MLGMSPTPEPPIHWDRHKTNFNITLIFALVIAVFGVFTGTPLMMIAGLGIAAYTWLTTARQYYIYRDALVIAYGRPRVKIIPFARVSHIELLTLPMGDRLRVQLVNSGQLRKLYSAPPQPPAKLPMNRQLVNLVSLKPL